MREFQTTVHPTLKGNICISDIVMNQSKDGTLQSPGNFKFETRESSGMEEIPTVMEGNEEEERVQKTEKW